MSRAVPSHKHVCGFGRVDHDGRAVGADNLGEFLGVVLCVQCGTGTRVAVLQTAPILHHVTQLTVVVRVGRQLVKHQVVDPSYLDPGTFKIN